MQTAQWTIALAVALSTCGGAAVGQSYPSKPIRIVVPYPPGGGTDLLARPIAQKLGQRWGQSVVIDNRGGANGMIGGEIVAKSAPDGYTILIGTSAELALNVAVYRKVPYDPERDFAPVTQLAISQVPSLDESGLRGLDVSQWWGAHAPAGTPGAVIARLQTELVQIVGLPDVKARMTELGMEAVGSSSEQFAALIPAEIAKYRRIAKAANIRID